MLKITWSQINISDDSRWDIDLISYTQTYQIFFKNAKAFWTFI